MALNQAQTPRWPGQETEPRSRKAREGELL